jgi:putative endonuclease
MMAGRVGVDNVEKGRVSEEYAAAHLSQDGYEVVARNQRTPLGELDIICRSDACIVMVEVKARSGSGYGDPLEGIGPRKERRLRGAAAWWLSERGMFPCAVRFDAVAVTLDSHGHPERLEHVADVVGNGQ